METKVRKKTTPYSAEFKAGAIQLVMEEGRVAEQVSRELGIASSTLSEWLKQARRRTEQGSGSVGALSLEEKQELLRLRKENRILQMEKEILKKATAFFAKESR